ncbi:MAG: PAS domain-containing protein [Acidobacteriaceae bacterium]|nr:PAS domain-containing protein [Acidobacteriaceae bacterium]
MKEITIGKLFGVWCLLMLSFPVAAFWIRDDFAPGSQLQATLKLALVLGLVAAASLGFTYVLALRWSLPTKRFEEFISAIPTQEIDLPVDGPAELNSLSRAMKAMAKRVRHVVEQANEELARRETILACMAEGVLAVDKDLRVIFCNDAFTRAFGTRNPTVPGLSLYELVREPLLQQILGRVLNTGSPETDRFQLPSAAGRWFEARALSFGSAARQGAIIVLLDITDIQRQEQVRKDFVADVSHELRTPLTAIRGYAETLLDGALDDAEHSRQFLQVIQSHAIRLNNIASDLLVLSELDSDLAPAVDPQKIAIPEVIRSAVETVSQAASERAVTVDATGAQSCWVIGYRHRLEQVVINLLDNAVKFNRPEGKVSIDCEPLPDSQVRISVADTGLGIPIEDTKRIFERFYRVDKARSRPAGGTGLGLPIVKEVLSRMGGTITVESQLGRGSRFTVVLPAQIASPETLSPRNGRA